jgi:hypothetical protein
MLLQHAMCEKVNRNQEAAIVIFEKSKKIAPGQMEIASQPTCALFMNLDLNGARGWRWESGRNLMQRLR